MYILKNPTKRPEGITTQPAGVIVNIEPGETSRPLDIADADIKLAKKRGIFEIREAKEADKKAPATAPEPHAASEASSLSESPKTAQELLDGVQGSGDDDGGDDFDGMTNEGLINYLKERDGRAPHPNTSREKLLARARAGEGSADEEEGV